MEKLQRWDEGRDILRPDSIFFTVGEAVASLSSAIKCPGLDGFMVVARIHQY